MIALTMFTAALKSSKIFQSLCNQDEFVAKHTQHTHLSAGDKYEKKVGVYKEVLDGARVNYTEWDKYTGPTGNHTIVGASPDDNLNGGSSRDFIFGKGGSDTLGGNSGHDYIFGGAGNDWLSGGGADTLIGGAGDDNLFGDDGNDALYGGSGNDTLTGGAGADIFVFRKGDSGKKVVTDFEYGVDKVYLRDASWERFSLDEKH